MSAANDEAQGDQSQSRRIGVQAFAEGDAIEFQEREAAAVLVYWFVADNQLTADHRQRMWWMARDLLRCGVLQRWAYVLQFSICEPGREETTFARLSEFIRASVPEYQLVPAPPKTMASVLAEPGGATH